MPYSLIIMAFGVLVSGRWRILTFMQFDFGCATFYFISILLYIVSPLLTIQATYHFFLLLCVNTMADIPVSFESIADYTLEGMLKYLYKG